MRFHIGKKIGGVYVGASTSGKKMTNGLGKAGGCLLKLLLLPILLCIWPVIGLYCYITKKPTEIWKLVLAWIVFLPVMGIVAIFRTGLPVAAKAGISAGILIVVSLIAIGGGSPASTEPNPVTVSAASASPALMEADPASAETPAPTQAAAPVAALLPTPTQAPAMAAQETAMQTATPIPTPALVEGYVNADELYLRAAPSGDGEILGTYTYGQPIIILGDSGGWRHVRIGEEEGYMSADYVSEGEAPAPTPTPAQASQQGASTSVEEVGQEFRDRVYITKTGDRFHYKNPCGAGTYFEVSLEEALARGLTPCGKCVD